jgi:transcriptional regulator with GAF, ATPase, and Fis domain
MTDPLRDPKPRPRRSSRSSGRISSVLQRTGWVIQGPRGAAAILGIHPNTLRSRMERLGIDRRRHGRS